MAKENKLDYITPEERKRWEEADIDIDLYKGLASTICAQSVDEYRDHLKNMRHLAYDQFTREQAAYNKGFKDGEESIIHKLMEFLRANNDK